MQNKYDGDPAKIENDTQFYRWLGSMKKASSVLIEQELENEKGDPGLKRAVEERVEESLRKTAAIVAENLMIRESGPRGLDGLGREQFDHRLASQKDSLEKDVRSEIQEVLAKRLNLTAEVEPLIQDMVNKKSSQAENVEFETSDAEDTDENDYTLPENEYREALRLLAQLEEVLPPTSDALDTLYNLLNQ
ncbi:hypothetical protein O0I10_008932 [Lichtheimia ornata]|uniref:Uncharacterized protein n=1 Tax=Lichtheimia ornata TaxID=688661 RepID=A0AAD7UYK2_9FUNG|nr:uncharacterized protein O0I10_008932 [Lichtheimia ornata]KAJ8655438.1 hypothetical protein O0I10_008932 [Lichtheimia ornata]